MKLDQQKTAAQQSQQNKADPDGRDCLHCALHAAFKAWYERQPTLGAYETGYMIGQFSAEIMDQVPPEFHRDFQQGHGEAQLTHLVHQDMGGGHVH